jgi:tRNA threonylcarbamoyladenosine biosynthesis protein TsaB
MTGRLVLAIDTSLGPVSAALLAADGRVLGVRLIRDAAGQHAEILPPMVADLFSACDADFAALGRVVVTTGPGAFTGVRVGIAFAKGLRLATGVELVGVSTLECLAVQAQGLQPGTRVGVVVDAKRDEVYAYARDIDGSHLLLPTLSPLSDASRKLSFDDGQRLTLFGSGRYLVSVPGATCAEVDVSDVDTVVLAQFGATAPTSSYPLFPAYLRAPDARLPA